MSDRLGGPWVAMVLLAFLCFSGVLAIVLYLARSCIRGIFCCAIISIPLDILFLPVILAYRCMLHMSEQSLKENSDEPLDKGRVFNCLNACCLLTSIVCSNDDRDESINVCEEDFEIYSNKKHKIIRV